MNTTQRTLRARTIRDAMASAGRSRVVNGCIHIFDRIQAWPKHEQIMAAAAAFMLICDSAGIKPNDAFTMTDNLMKSALRSPDGTGAQIRAMKYHLDTEINTDA